MSRDALPARIAALLSRSDPRGEGASISCADARYCEGVETLGKLLLGLGLLLVAAGAAFLLASRLGIRRLPGDVVVRRGSFTLYAPLGLMIVLSVLLTIVLNLIFRR